MNTLTIRGPRGSFDVCAITGQILTPYLEIPEDYRRYSSVNVRELQSWCDGTGVSLAKEVPILCVGLAEFDGRYSEPEFVYRDEWQCANQAAA